MKDDGLTTRKLLATLVTLLVVCVGTGCSTCSVTQGPPVTLPKPDAAADVVVRAYLAAVAARDDEAVRLLSAPAHYRRVHSWPDDPLDTWADVQVSEVGEPTPDEYGPGGHRQVRSVAVVIEVRRCDEDPPNDDRHWPHMFLTGRQSDDAPWKVIGFGAG
ncbi:hypothetical protein [Nonomuraea sp. NPDC001831]|uniref:hypothetical protein n=1 Tax=Nonomuraea sp. NPDC001831 TaxID=3364340 RepID=UPI0036B5046B